MTFPLFISAGGVEEYLLKGDWREYSPPYLPYSFQILVPLYLPPHFP